MARPKQQQQQRKLQPRGPRKQQVQRAPARKKRAARRGGMGGSFETRTVPAAYLSSVMNPREASQVFHNEELWVQAPTDVTVRSVAFTPGNTGMPLLDTEAARFDLYHLQSCELIYKPNSASTTPGRVMFALDYDATRLATTAVALNTMQPQARTQSFVPATLRVDPGRANKQRWLRTSNGQVLESTAFAMTYAASVAQPTVGEIWCRYTVTFTGPRAPVAPAVAYRISSTSSVRAAFTADQGQLPFYAEFVPAGGSSVNVFPIVRSPGKYVVTMSGMSQTSSSTINSWTSFLTTACPGEFALTTPEATPLQLNTTTVLELSLTQSAFAMPGVVPSGRIPLPIVTGTTNSVFTVVKLATGDSERWQTVDIPVSLARGTFDGILLGRLQAVERLLGITLSDSSSALPENDEQTDSSSVISDDTDPACSCPHSESDC